MLECGRRFEEEDFVKTTWNLWRYYWVPKLRMKGILRLTLFNDILIASGCGVGGGSLGYANTLYRPSSAFYQGPIWRDSTTGRRRCGRASTPPSTLPGISKRLGYRVRTNRESIPAVTVKNDRLDFTKSVAISSSIDPSEDTHIENVTYGPGADSMAFLWTLSSGRAPGLTRPLRFLARAARHSVQLARATWPHRFSDRTVILLVMQTLDNSMRLKPKRRLLGRGVGLTTEQDPENPKPDLHPRRRLGGSPRGREARRRGPSSAVPANPPPPPPASTRA